MGRGRTGDEGVGADDVEGGDAAELLRVVDARRGEDLLRHWDQGVDRVGNDVDERGRAHLGDGLDQA